MQWRQFAGTLPAIPAVLSAGPKSSIPGVISIALFDSSADVIVERIELSDWPARKRG